MNLEINLVALGVTVPLKMKSLETILFSPFGSVYGSARATLI